MDAWGLDTLEGGYPCSWLTEMPYDALYSIIKDISVNQEQERCPL